MAISLGILTQHFQTNPFPEKTPLMDKKHRMQPSEHHQPCFDSDFKSAIYDWITAHRRCILRISFCSRYLKLCGGGTIFNWMLFKLYIKIPISMICCPTWYLKMLSPWYAEILNPSLLQLIPFEFRRGSLQSLNITSIGGLGVALDIHDPQPRGSEPRWQAWLHLWSLMTSARQQL